MLHAAFGIYYKRIWHGVPTPKQRWTAPVEKLLLQ